eukprot:6189043-Pleurochrysis_carterae.AAC.4
MHARASTCKYVHSHAHADARLVRSCACVPARACVRARVHAFEWLRACGCACVAAAPALRHWPWGQAAQLHRVGFGVVRRNQLRSVAILVNGVDAARNLFELRERKGEWVRSAERGKENKEGKRGRGRGWEGREGGRAREWKGRGEKKRKRMGGTEEGNEGERKEGKERERARERELITAQVIYNIDRSLLAHLHAD